MRIAHVPDPLRPHCEPVEMLTRLMNMGRMPRFTAAWGNERGDCHEIVMAILLDLASVGIRNWRWCRGVFDRIGDHSWLEVDGWAIDAANGSDEKPIIVMRAADYRKVENARDIRSTDGRTMP